MLQLISCHEYEWIRGRGGHCADSAEIEGHAIPGGVGGEVAPLDMQSGARDGEMRGTDPNSGKAAGTQAGLEFFKDQTSLQAPRL